MIFRKFNFPVSRIVIVIVTQGNGAEQVILEPGPRHSLHFLLAKRQPGVCVYLDVLLGAVVHNTEVSPPKCRRHQTRNNNHICVQKFSRTIVVLDFN